MKRWKKVVLGIIFIVILFVIGYMQHIVLGLISAIILSLAFILINIRDEHHKITSNRHSREKYYDSTRKRQL